MTEISGQVYKGYFRKKNLVFHKKACSSYFFSLDTKVFRYLLKEGMILL